MTINMDLHSLDDSVPDDRPLDGRQNTRPRLALARRKYNRFPSCRDTPSEPADKTVNLPPVQHPLFEDSPGNLRFANIWRF